MTSVISFLFGERSEGLSETGAAGGPSFGSVAGDAGRVHNRRNLTGSEAVHGCRNRRVRRVG